MNDKARALLEQAGANAQQIANSIELLLLNPDDGELNRAEETRLQDIGHQAKVLASRLLTEFRPPN